MDGGLLNILEHSSYPVILKLCKANKYLQSYCKNYPKHILQLIFKSAGFQNLESSYSTFNLKEIFKFLYKRDEHLESFLNLKYYKLAMYPLAIQNFLLENCIVFDCSNQDLSELPINLFNVIELDCSENKLQRVFDFSVYRKLKKLNCSNNNLIEIKLPDELKTLNCEFNHLSSFSNSKLIYLQHLTCEFNNLQINNLPYIPNIESINLIGNEITKPEIKRAFIKYSKLINVKIL
jgi:hypothetical protein